MANEILTTVVGSYPIPHWLMGQPNSLVALRDATMAVLKTQELAGLDVISDGELSRFDPNHPETNGMIDYFVRRMSGVDSNLTRKEIDSFREISSMSFRAKPVAVVRGEIGDGTLDLKSDWQQVKELTEKPLKFTVTSPLMLAKTLLDLHYRDLGSCTRALAEVLRRQIADIDAPVIQVDEAHLPGHPEDSELAAETINHLLSGVRGERGVHLCFGNYGGQTIQKGLWKSLIAFFNQLNCDHLVLEFARRGYSELEFFKELKPEIRLGVGVIDIKDNEVETPDTIAQRIDHAVQVLGEERIRYVHPDCGFWMLSRSVTDRKIKTLVAGRNLVANRC